MTTEEYGQRNARDADLAHQKAYKRYRDNSDGYQGPYIVGFRDGLDHGREEMETQAVLARLENARKLEEENVRLREEIERLKRLDFCPEEDAALSAPTAPQYSESALDRFAEKGAKAWANPPESARLIRQVEPGESTKPTGKRFSSVAEMPAHYGMEYIEPDEIVAWLRERWPQYVSLAEKELRADAARSRGEGKE